MSRGCQRGAQVLLRVLTVAVFVALGLLGFGGDAAHAQGDDGDDAAQVVRGRVINEREEDGERIRENVAGVRIVVETESGEVVGEAVTDDDGAYLIGIAEPGDYIVRLDDETLPEGVSAQDGEDSLAVNVRANSSTTRAFFLGEDLRQATGKLGQLPQTLFHGFKLATIIAITSIGLSLVFGTTGLSNFAHGEMVTFGALLAWGLNRAWAGVHLIPAALVAIVLSALAGGMFEVGVWRRLRRSGTSLTSMMIVSIGLALGLRHLFLFRAGGDLKQYGQYTRQRESLITLGPIDLTPRSLSIIVISLLVILGLAFFLLRTRFGKAIRAVSDNPELASSSGIDAERVVLVVWVLGGALAGLGGVFYGLEYGIRWDMGFTLLLLMFAAIILGGLGNPFGALVGALIIGTFVELWTWVLPSAVDMKNVGALIALIALLLVRPQGLLGSKERVG